LGSFDKYGNPNHRAQWPGEERPWLKRKVSPDLSTPLPAACTAARKIRGTIMKSKLVTS
jgi:hypothetical protein